MLDGKSGVLPWLHGLCSQRSSAPLAAAMTFFLHSCQLAQPLGLRHGHIATQRQLLTFACLSAHRATGSGSLELTSMLKKKQNQQIFQNIPNFILVRNWKTSFQSRMIETNLLHMPCFPKKLSLSILSMDCWTPKSGVEVFIVLHMFTVLTACKKKGSRAAFVIFKTKKTLMFKLIPDLQQRKPQVATL